MSLFFPADWGLGFAHPWLLPLWLLYPLCLRYCRRREEVRDFGNLQMLKTTAGQGFDPIPWVGGLTLLLLLVALAEPYDIRSERSLQARGREIALLLDASNSMSDEGRFDEARKILADFIRSRRHDRIALEVFGDRAAIASAATEDRPALLKILKALKPGVAGGRETALYEALFRAPELFEADYRGPKVAILLTDGIDTAGTIPLQAALRRLRRHGVKVYTVGIGEDYRGEILRRIARETGGRYYGAAHPKELAEIYRRIDALERSPLRGRLQRVRFPLQRYALAGAALTILLLLWLRRRDPGGRLLLLLSLLATGAAFASAPSPTGRNAPAPKAALMILLDLSRSMRARDLPPDRLHWSLGRLKRLLETLPAGTPIGLLGFTGESYLVTPPVANRQALEWILGRLPLQRRLTPGSDPLEAIRSGIEYLRPWKRRDLLLVSDGGSAPLLHAALPLLGESNTTLFAYPAATRRGAPIPAEGGGYLQDASGAVVISRLNPAIIELSRQSGGYAPDDPTDAEAFERLASALSQGLKSDSNPRDNGPEIPTAFATLWRLMAFGALALLIVALFKVRTKDTP